MYNSGSDILGILISRATGKALERSSTSASSRRSG